MEYEQLNISLNSNSTENQNGIYNNIGIGDIDNDGYPEILLNLINSTNSSNYTYKPYLF